MIDPGGPKTYGSGSKTLLAGAFLGIVSAVKKFSFCYNFTSYVYFNSGTV
jgi:hypothetical protein